MFEAIIKKQLSQFVDLNSVPPAMIDHGITVRERLQEHLEEKPDGLPFQDFMNFALYAPGLGYYGNGKEKIGERGDFITAPEMGPFFAQSLAQPVADYLNRNGGNIIEFGAGMGTLAGDLLAALAASGCLPENYYILEVSADLRELQQRHISTNFPDLVDRVCWLDALPENFSGIVLANEVLDAMPVHQYYWDESGPAERHVVTDECGNLGWKLGAVSEKLKQHLEFVGSQHYFDDIEGPYYTEVNAQAGYWLKALSQTMTDGLVFLIDYGYSGQEYYHKQRNTGTVQCFFRHQAHDNPLTLVGLQDITAHVNFSEVAILAHEYGFAIKGYDTQASFLLQTGILELAAGMETADVRSLLLQNQALKRLMSPGGMGEMFKVMVLAKGVDDAVLGCRARDLRSHL